MNVTETSNNTKGLPAESQYVLIVLYTLTATMAVSGNLLVLVVFSFGRRSRTDLRPFLVNLAVADLVMAVFCMPFTFTYTMLHDWIFGEIMCPLVLFCQMCAVTASVGTSTAIAVDRYLVVAHPLQARNPKFRARCALCLVWTIACLFSSTQLFVGRSGSLDIDGMHRTGCAENWPDPVMRRFFSFFVLVATYLLPLTIIAVTYGLVAWRLWRHKTPGNADNARDKLQLVAKKKVIKMLITVVVLFGVCWLPLHIFGLVIDFMPELNNENQAEASTTGAAVYTTVHWLAMSNSFVNPIIYGFLNDSFRNDLKWLLTCCCYRCSGNRRLRAATATRDHFSYTNRNNSVHQKSSSLYNDGAQIKDPTKSGKIQQQQQQQQHLLLHHHHHHHLLPPHNHHHHQLRNPHCDDDPLSASLPVKQQRRISME